MKYSLYLTDHGPNGCNTLLVIDENNQLVDALDDATFGVQIPRNPLLNALLIDGMELVSAPDSVDELCESDVVCTDVQAEFVAKRRACNPIDPNGDKVLTFLTKYGFEF